MTTATPFTISIITVTYNSASTLASAIESVTNQTYPHIEYIIIDGSSKDNTCEIVKKYGNKISKFICEPDSGIYNAMNKGLKLATGNVIGFLHADDQLATPNTVEDIANTFKVNNINVTYGNLEYVNRDNINQVIRYWKSCPFQKNVLAKGWMPPHPTLYIASDTFKNIGGFNEAYRIAADYDFILRLFSSPNISPFFINQTLVKMKVGGASNRSIANIIKKSKEDYLALRRNKIGGLTTLIIKNLSKIHQFITRKK